LAQREIDINKVRLKLCREKEELVEIYLKGEKRKGMTVRSNIVGQ
jgi:hypothetical protein